MASPPSHQFSTDLECLREAKAIDFLKLLYNFTKMHTLYLCPVSGTMAITYAKYILMQIFSTNETLIVWLLSATIHNRSLQHYHVVTCSLLLFKAILVFNMSRL